MKKYKKRFLFAGLAILMAMACPSDLSARPKGKLIELETQTVEGQLQKPLVFYQLGRRELQFRDLKPQKSLLYLIEESVKKSPF